MIGVLAVAYPLEHQRAAVIRATTEQSRVTAQAAAWPEGRDADVQDVTPDPADRFHVTIDLIGTPPLPAPATLVRDVARAVGHPVTLTVLFTPRTHIELHSDSVGRPA